MSTLERASMVVENPHSSFAVFGEDKEIVASTSSLNSPYLARIAAWEQLLQERGLLTEDEKELIDCLLWAAQASLV